MKLRPSILALLSLILVFSVNAFSQGGKAEPNLIELPESVKPLIISSRLRNGQEAEYVFLAKKGETIVISNPNPSLFDVRIYHAESEFDTEYDSSRTFEVELESDGDHVLFIRRKVGGPRSAAFRITLSKKKPAE